MTWPEIWAATNNIGVGSILSGVIGAGAALIVNKHQQRQAQELSNRSVNELRRRVAWDVFIEFLKDSPDPLGRLNTIMRKKDFARWDQLLGWCLSPPNDPNERGLQKHSFEILIELVHVSRQCLPALSDGQLKDDLVVLRNSVWAFRDYIDTKPHGDAIGKNQVLAAAALVPPIPRIIDEIYAFLSEAATSGGPVKAKRQRHLPRSLTRVHPPQNHALTVHHS